MSEEQRQSEKEQAVLLALQHEMAVIRDGLQVFGMKKDGSKILISESTDYENLWKDALFSLKNDYQ